MIDLQPFCSLDETRASIVKPWSKGAYSYATNGHIIVRVPRSEDVPENKAAPETEQLFYRASVGMSGAPRSQAPATEEPPRKTCDACEGTGKSKQCPEDECEEGTVVFTTTRHSYEFTCRECDGSGYIAGAGGDCRICEGTGLGGYEHNAIRVGTQHFDQLYLSLITKHLPCCWITCSTGKHLDAALLEFDGGVGLIMPINMTP